MNDYSGFLSLKWTFRCFHPQHKQMNWSVVKEYQPVSLSLPSPCWMFWESKPTIETVDKFIDFGMSFQAQLSQFSLFANIRWFGFFNR